MTLVIAKPLTLASTYVGVDDPDAATYIAAVEAADGQALETATRVAIHSFVKGCKNDGIWSAIKASCILAGARTLSGALVPLVGTAPTNNNFVSGDYNRKTGLVGNGSTKYLNSNSVSAQLATNYHQAVYVIDKPTLSSSFVASDDLSNQRYLLYCNITANETRAISGTLGTAYFGGSGSLEPGFKGVTRNNASTFTARAGSTNSTVSSGSSVSASLNSFVFATNSGSNAQSYSNARLAFYSIGESLDLAKLDTHVTGLINAFGAAIP